ncbi:hypothetical protein BASA60_006122 [Batrachochytrium salamandrivorans]|nr:hypothetical protein BASA60_006122 [Batrachochytrium salamandrivorans]
MSFGVAKCGIMHVAPIPAPLSRLRFCQLNNPLETAAAETADQTPITPSSHPSSPISPSSPLSIYSDISSTSSYHPSSPLSTSSSIYIPASPVPQPALFPTPATPTQTQLTHPIQLHGIDLPSASQYEYLGVIIDDLLTLSPWLVKKKRAITAAVHSISPLLRNNFLSTRYRLTIFNGLVLGVAYYGLELIGGNSTLARRLQAPVNTGICMILKAPLFTPIAPMLTDCGIISLDAHAILARVRLTVKATTLKTPLRTLLLPSTIPSHSNSCNTTTSTTIPITPTISEIRHQRSKYAFERTFQVWGKSKLACSYVQANHASSAKFLRSPALSTGQAIGPLSSHWPAVVAYGTILGHSRQVSYTPQQQTPTSWAVPAGVYSVMLTWTASPWPTWWTTPEFTPSSSSSPSGFPIFSFFQFSPHTRFEPPISVAHSEIPRQVQDTVEENSIGSRTTTTDTHTAAISSTPTPTHISHIGSDDILTVLLGGSLPGTNTAGNTEAYPGQQWLTGTVEEGNLLSSNQPIVHRKKSERAVFAFSEMQSFSGSNGVIRPNQIRPDWFKQCQGKHEKDNGRSFKAQAYHKVPAKTGSILQYTLPKTDEKENLAKIEEALAMHYYLTGNCIFSNR